VQDGGESTENEEEEGNGDGGTIDDDSIDRNISVEVNDL